ncbi:MAG: helix-turn-helix transcriptional regulator [Bacteroidetes bacterium]|nr:helix-turn-helix transcriptional regulator [Bacteroidota bacterium]
METLFKIYKIDTDEALKITKTPDEPHAHNFEELIIGIKGRLKHFIDFKTVTIQTPFVSFVTKGKVHRAVPMVENGVCDMWVLRFKSELIPDIIFQLYASFHNHSTFKISEQNCFARLDSICEVIHHEMKHKNPDLSVIKHLLSALFLMIEAEKNKTSSDTKNFSVTQNKTLYHFLKILEENYQRPLGADFYAQKLFMSARNLNLISKNILQQTVSELIETRKLIEAKNQLIHSDKNISEIGYDLGFNEKAYFTNAFKKRTGQTPSNFRKEMRKLLS